MKHLDFKTQLKESQITDMVILEIVFHPKPITFNNYNNYNFNVWLGKARTTFELTKIWTNKTTQHTLTQSKLNKRIMTLYQNI